MPVDIDELLAQMTLDEKLAQLGGVWITVAGRRRRRSTSRRRATSHRRTASGTSPASAPRPGCCPGESAALMNEIQRFAVEETRLGIPVIVHEESTAGYCARGATVFPQAIGLAVHVGRRPRRRGRRRDPPAAGRRRRPPDARAGARRRPRPALGSGRGDLRRGPVPRRPHRAPPTCAACRRSSRDGVLATAKHFLGYALSEGGMNHAPVQLGPRELREVYAEPFAAAIRDADLQSVMNSYSSVDGIPCAGDPSILTDAAARRARLRRRRGRRLLRRDAAHDPPPGRRRTTVRPRRSPSPPVSTSSCRPPTATASRSAAGARRRPCRWRWSTAPCGGCSTPRTGSGSFDEPYVDAAAARRGVRHRRSSAPWPAERRPAPSSLLTNDGVLPLAARPRAHRRDRAVAPTTLRLLQGDYHYPAHAEITYERADSDAGARRRRAARSRPARTTRRT